MNAKGEKIMDWKDKVLQVMEENQGYDYPVFFKQYQYFPSGNTVLVDHHFTGRAQASARRNVAYYLGFIDKPVCFSCRANPALEKKLNEALS
jgi:hypothetical protein